MTDSPFGYKRVTVRGNSAYGPSWHGCSIVGAVDTIVEDNFFQGIVETDPKAQTISPWIKLDKPGANVVERNNVIAKNAKRGNKAALEAWLARKKAAHLDQPLTTAALTLGGVGAILAATPSRRGAIVGMLAQVTGAGGRMTRG
jgi:hypothetical protein